MENGKVIRRETGKETMMENEDKNRSSNLSQLIWCLGSFVAQAESFSRNRQSFLLWHLGSRFRSAREIPNSIC